MASDPLVLGVDVGGTKVAAGAVVGGEARGVVERPTALASSDALLDGIEGTVKEAAAASGEPAAVGVGMPSQIEYGTGLCVSSVNIPLTGVPLRQELGRRLGVPVFVDNDANCAALAEAELVGARHLVMLTLGTGVGGGVVIDGRIFRGADGLGAELGHLTIDANGPPCPGNCPNRGCVEALCSGTALARDATELGKDRPEGPLGRIHAEKGRVEGPEAVAAARDGDAEAGALLERLGTWLGVAVAGFVNVFQPELFVIGGGLSRAADLFLERARDEAASRALPALWERVELTVAKGGADAGLIGAGLLAAQESGRGARVV
ncbi:MAG: ROK family protein [Thermoleophilaceae bacterium]